ncbi:MAG: hypothetical protein WA771_11780 [Chthoniobacterales bacterium]
MNRLLPFLLCFALILNAADTDAADAISLKDRSISSSKQFVVYADDPSVRSEITRKAEDYKAEFLKFLGLDDEHDFTIILNLAATPPSGRKPPESKLGLYELDGGDLKVQLDVFDLDYLDDPAFDRDLMSTILLEYAYRDNATSAGRSFETPPAWVVEALLEKMRVRNDGPQASAYAALLTGGKTPRVDDFFRTREDRLDPTSRLIFRAQSLAMLDTLSDLPDGRAGLRRYLSVPRRTPSSTKEVVELFPSLSGERENLARKWVLAIARSSSTDRVDLLGVRDSASQLAEILDVQALPDPRRPEVAAMSGPLALGAIARSKSGEFILTQMRNDLLRLSVRAHPLYRSITDEYLQIVGGLLVKPKRRVEKRIAAAEEVRARLARKTDEMDNYLDWVETTKIKTESETFSEIVEDTEEAVGAPPRPDAISRFLDNYSEQR